MSGWYAALVRCFICTYEWGAVWPASGDEDRLECPSCGAQDSEVVEYWPPQK